MQHMTRDDVISKYTGRLRQRYEKAKIDLNDHPLQRSDGRINCFMKVEKFNKATLQTKPPRVIQGRDPKYNLEIMRFLRPVEHWFYRNDAIFKGKNLEQRAETIARYLGEFDSPHVYSIDCSKCDAHLHTRILQLEHAIYLKCHNNHPKLQQMCAWQLENHGRTPNGCEYTTKGRRASGDFNTGLGNSIICYAVLKSILKRLGYKYRIGCDGDDCFFVVGRSLTQIELGGIRQSYLDIGLEITLDVPEFPEALVHCQTSLINTPVPIMVRRPWDTISKCLTSQKYFENTQTMNGFLNQMAMCELSLHRGVPVMQDFFKYILRHTKPTCNKRFDDEFSYRVKLASQMAAKDQDITIEARISFENAFGFDVEEQRMWERRFETEDVLNLATILV